MEPWSKWPVYFFDSVIGELMPWEMWRKWLWWNWQSEWKEWNVVISVGFSGMVHHVLLFFFITSLLWDPICTYRPIYFVGFMNSWLSQNKLPSVTSNISKISIPVGYVSWTWELGCWSRPDHLSHSCFPCLGNSGAPGREHCFPLFGPVLF